MHNPTADTIAVLGGFDIPILDRNDIDTSEGLLVEIESDDIEWRSLADKWNVVGMAVTVQYSGRGIEHLVAETSHQVRERVETIPAYLLHSAVIQWEPVEDNSRSAVVRFILRYRE